ncbi:MAG: formylglycine-generating enzyme family protein, partial [Methylococcales bacterium]
RAFVDTTGFPIGNTNALRDPDNRPVRYVSWQEALAYCNWLNEGLKSVESVASSEICERVRSGKWRVDLPSEMEWEKAARGGLPNAVFSWGDTPDPQSANYADSNIGDTSAAGCFPLNQFGLHDLIGNVWEWTRGLWGFDYPYDRNCEDRDAGNEGLRVVRGGSWGSLRDYARCAFGSGDPPDYRLDDLGFRVVLRSAPVP